MEWRMDCANRGYLGTVHGDYNTVRTSSSEVARRERESWMELNRYNTIHEISTRCAGPRPLFE